MAWCYFQFSLARSAQHTCTRPQSHRGSLSILSCEISPLRRSCPRRWSICLSILSCEISRGDTNKWRPLLDRHFQFSLARSVAHNLDTRRAVASCFQFSLARSEIMCRRRVYVAAIFQFSLARSVLSHLQIGEILKGLPLSILSCEIRHSDYGAAAAYLRRAFNSLLRDQFLIHATASLWNVKILSILSCEISSLYCSATPPSWHNPFNSLLRDQLMYENFDNIILEITFNSLLRDQTNWILSSGKCSSNSFNSLLRDQRD